MAAILLDSICRIRIKEDDKHFPQNLLEECELKKKKQNKDTSKKKQ